MLGDIRRIIIDEGTIKRSGKAVDTGKRQRIHALLTSVMKNGGMAVNRNRMEKKKEKWQRISSQSFYLLRLLCVFWSAILWRRSIKCLSTFYLKLKVNSTRLEPPQEMEKLQGEVGNRAHRICWKINLCKMDFISVCGGDKAGCIAGGKTKIISNISYPGNGNWKTTRSQIQHEETEWNETRSFTSS